MRFLIADSFTASLARLTGDEQKQVKLATMSLQLDASHPGLQFHKLGKARDPHFWSVRVSADLRIIVHRLDESLLVCYVDHHDKAYEWAERRKLTVHPTTGAAQLVEVRETVQTIMRPVYVDAPTPAPTVVRTPPLAQLSDETLLAYGVPTDWLADLKAATDDALLELAEHLPAEAAEAVLELAVGRTPPRPEPVAIGVGPFEHPDAQRRFRIMDNAELLEAALDAPWEQWTVFLHPEQRQLVERRYGGPARVAGSAGTGKTVVALHRAVHLARTNADARVLLTTFSDTLASALQAKLRRLLAGEPRLAERIDVLSLPAVRDRLHRALVGPATIATADHTRAALDDAMAAIDGHAFSTAFVRAEWQHVVEPWMITTWDGYRDVARLGRKTRLPEVQRQRLWQIFERALASLQAQGLVTESASYHAVAGALRAVTHLPFDHAVVDEAQDLGVPQLRMLAALGGDRSDALFFAGDLGQRIFQQPFSWKSVGVDVRGRSRVLRVNYRTSHQIRQQADRLLGQELTDVDGLVEDRRGTLSVFNGPAPEIRTFPTADAEAAEVSAWIRLRTAGGMRPHEIAVMVRSDAELPRAVRAVSNAGETPVVLDDRVDARNGAVAVCTMHRAKGLEFRAVAVMACDEDILPLQQRIAAVGDEADLEEVYNTERQLLYVACTRARDVLLVSGVAPGSEFLEDMVVPSR
jgi:hypothetical protein